MPVKKQFTGCGRLQNTLLGQNLSFRVEEGPFVQIIHGCGHWLCVTRSGRDNGEVEVIDSMFCTLPVIAVKHSQYATLNHNFLDTQQQCGSSDCGLYAIAIATAICEGEDPCKQLFNQDAMRSHLLRCLEMGKMTLFPSKKRTVPSEKRVKSTQRVVVTVASHHVAMPQVLRMVSLAV